MSVHTNVSLLHPAYNKQRTCVYRDIQIKHYITTLRYSATFHVT